MKDSLKLAMAEKLKLVLKMLFIQVLLFCVLVFLFWGSQKFYSFIDPTTFPEAYPIPDTKNMDDKTKGKILVDAITNQMKRELSSTFGWTANDIIFNKYLLDNRAYRQIGVYHATKILIDQYAMRIAKLGSNGRESGLLYSARLNNFSIDPRSFIFPSAEGAYNRGFELIEKYKQSLDDGTGIYNCRTDDLYSSFDLMAGENMLGYALGLLQNAQNLPFYTLDNRIYEVQGIALVVRDFITAIYKLYPEIQQKNTAENMQAVKYYLDQICTYNPLYITSTFNSGELIISYLMFAKNRIEDMRDSIKM